ncbi:Putative Zn-dependent protease [Cyclobacterium lianum]|uniref:Putative Zn-dependent protease n=1 Tax=Cyclobacterium lianum TaxID=388280 RepID=A0A1M7N634_9BACT|nr:M48 family metalloprotease [Cyclobacterium lianum]SHM99064.1 Putative Zn-dependent protease [Cyclobacterium lianum]
MSAILVFQRAFLLGLLFIQISCARNPVTGKKQLVLMSEKQEIEMGKSSDPEIMAYFGRYDDPDLQAFITEKGNEMAAISHRPKLEYEFKIVDSPVINAFAVPGGFVYFTRGIMAHFNNEAEFAGVLGHEIGHVTARHSVIQQRNAMLGQLGMIAGIVLVPQLSDFVEPLSQGMQLALLSFGRDAERQSDELGVEYSSKIGYDAVEMAGFFETLERQQAKQGGSPVPEFLSTHPSPSERNVTVARLAQDWKAKLDLNETEINRESYLRRIEGLVYGEDPRQGFVENQVFYHPELKFYFPVPGEWSLQNTPQQVQMAPKSGEAVMSLTLSSGDNLRDLANQMVEQYKLEVLSIKEEKVNGLSSLQLQAAQTQENGSSIRLLVYFIRHAETTYRLMGLAEGNNFGRYEQDFLGTMNNFSELKAADKLNRQPERLAIKSINQPTTLERALKNYQIPDKRLEEMAILNGMRLDETLEAGTLIKVVE